MFKPRNRNSETPSGISEPSLQRKLRILVNHSQALLCTKRIISFQQLHPTIEAVTSLLHFDSYKTIAQRERDNVESYTPECLHPPLLVPWAAMDPRYPLLVWVLWALAVSHPPETT